MSKAKGKSRTKTDTRARVTDRIARLGGQVEALRRMTEAGAEWKKLLMLAAAVEGASDQVTADLFQGYLESLAGGKGIALEAREGLELVLKRL